jgi:hypothetical protein
MPDMPRSRSAGVLLVALICILVNCARAEKVTATTDYGFGPLWIDYSTEGETLQRCDNVTINLGGGFGPYYLGEVVSGMDTSRTLMY